MAIKSLASNSSVVRRRAGPRGFEVWDGDSRAVLRPTLAERFSDFGNELACYHWLFQEDHIVPIERGAQTRRTSTSRHQEGRDHEAFLKKPVEKVNAAE